VLCAVFDAEGNLYAPTWETRISSVAQLGSIFELSPEAGGKWQFNSLYVFCANGFPCTGGLDPGGLLTLDNAGNVYGTAEGGGKTDTGVVFQIVPYWS
jgi:uncharacterized repeat protein (TIGR03803 family)